METVHKLYKCELCDFYSEHKQNVKRHILAKHCDFVKCNNCDGKVYTFLSNNLVVCSNCRTPKRDTETVASEQ